MWKYWWVLKASPVLADSTTSGLDSSWWSVSDAWLIFNKTTTDSPPPLSAHCPFVNT